MTVPTPASLEAANVRERRAVKELLEAVAEVAEALGPHRMVGGSQRWDAIKLRLNRVRQLLANEGTE